MRKQKVLKKMKWPFLKIASKNASLVEDNTDQLEETLSGELGSHECCTNNLFPAIKWIKPFCTVNWRLLLFLLIYFWFLFFSSHGTTQKVNYVIFNQRLCSTPWKWWWPFYRTSRTYLANCKAQVRSLFSFISRLLQIWWLKKQLIIET